MPNKSPKQFNTQTLRNALLSQQLAAPFVGGQRISGAVADLLNKLPDVLDALKEHQGGEDVDEPAPEVEARVNRHAIDLPKAADTEEPGYGV